MRKLFASLVVIAMSLSLVPVSALQANADTVTLVDGTYNLAAITGSIEGNSRGEGYNNEFIVTVTDNKVSSVTIEDIGAYGTSFIPIATDYANSYVGWDGNTVLDTSTGATNSSTTIQRLFNRIPTQEEVKFMEDGVYPLAGTISAKGTVTIPDGFSYDITVTVENNEVKTIDVVETGGTTWAESRINDYFASLIGWTGNEAIDSFSGATASTAYMTDHIYDEIIDGNVRPEAPTKPETPETPEEVEMCEYEAFVDGTYKLAGNESVYGGTLDVDVVVTNNKVSSVKINNHGTSGAPFDANNIKFINGLVGKETASNLDTATGATSSSKLVAAEFAKIPTETIEVDCSIYGQGELVSTTNAMLPVLGLAVSGLYVNNRKRNRK